MRMVVHRTVMGVWLGMSCFKLPNSCVREGLFSSRYIFFTRPGDDSRSSSSSSSPNTVKFNFVGLMVLEILSCQSVATINETKQTTTTTFLIQYTSLKKTFLGVTLLRHLSNE